MSRDEARMHALLADFSRAIRQQHASAHSAEDYWLALSVLHKRALSSARSLQHSINRRLATLASEDGTASQLDLPLGDPAGELTPDDDSASLVAAPPPRGCRSRAPPPRRTGGCRRPGGPARDEDCRARAASPARQRTRDRIHGVSRHAVARPGISRGSVRDASRGNDPRRTAGRHQPVHERRQPSPARDRCRRRRTQSPADVPARRQSGTAVESDAARAAHRPRRSNRPAPRRCMFFI